MTSPFVAENPVQLHHEGDLLHPKLHEALSIEFCRSAIHAGVQTPVNGVVQLADKVAGSDVLPKVQFIDPCEPAEFLTGRWHVQQIGAMFGTASNMLALSKAVGFTGNALFGSIENSAANQSRLALRAIEEAVGTGFVHNALFKPVASTEGDFYHARLKNGLIGAGTYAALTASSLGIKYLGHERNDMLGSFMRSEVGSTILSGIPGGVFHAELKSIADGKGLADRKSVGEAVYSFSVLGGAWAAGKEVFGGTGAEDFLREQMRRSSLLARHKDLLPPLLQSEQ